MLRDSDFCRNLRAAVVGTRGGNKHRRTRRQEMGVWAQRKPILPPCKLDHRRAPTMAVLMHPACEFKQPRSVCRGKKLWFHWLRPEVISCLDREKKKWRRASAGHMGHLWERRYRIGLLHTQEGLLVWLVFLWGTLCVPQGYKKGFIFDIERTRINLNLFLFLCKKKKKHNFYVIIKKKTQTMHWHGYPDSF